MSIDELTDDELRDRLFERLYARLLRITLDWEHRPGQPRPEPWTASVFRTADGARLALTGSMEGTVEDVVDDIVQAFLNRTAQVEGMS